MLGHRVRMLPPRSESIVNRVALGSPAALALRYRIDVVKVEPHADAGLNCRITCHNPILLG